MKRTVLFVTSVVLVMVVLGGVAWAAKIQCPNYRSPQGSIYRPYPYEPFVVNRKLRAPCDAVGLTGIMRR